MPVVHFLMLMALFCNFNAHAAVRHALRPFEHQVRIVSRTFSNFSSIEEGIIVIHNDATKKFGNMVLVQCPKDEGSFCQITGLCKPRTDYSKQNKKISEWLTYKGGTDFTDADVDSAVRPTIPNLPGIKTPEDILRVAKFYKEYANFMTVHFLKTKEVLGEYVNGHRIALLSEPEILLDLVRPCAPIQVRERVAVRAKNALQYPRVKVNRFISFFCSNVLNLEFGHFDRMSWENWHPENKDLIDAILCFGKAIYKDTPDIEAYKTAEEFNAALMEIDPDFKQLVTGN